MKKVIAYFHTHWDREWYREFEEFRLRLIEVIDEVINQLKNGGLPCFYFDGQTAILEDYLKIRPEKEEIVKKLVYEKKLRIGPFFCSSDSFLVNAQCLQKNLEIGIEYAKKMGETDFIGYIADSFGHSRDLPLLLKNFNISKVCLWRGLGDLNADLLWHNLEVTNLIQGYFQNFLHSSLPVKKKAENLKSYIDKIAEKSSDNILLPIGGDHLGCIKNPIDTINQLNKIYKDYNIEIGTPFDYFSKITKREKVSGEFLNNDKTFLLKGVYSARPYIKRANAKSQWLLTKIAEPLNSLAARFYGVQNRQNEINYAYKELIKNQAHDSIYGCTIDSVADEIIQRYKKVDVIANGVIKRILRDLREQNNKLFIVNLSNYSYSGKVFIESEKTLPPFLNAVKLHTTKGFTDKKLYDIYDVPITEDITNINTYLIDIKDLKPFSLINIEENNVCREKNIKIGKNFIENRYIKIEINNNEIVVTDKKNKEIYFDFIKLTNRADIGDSYNFGALNGDREIKGRISTFKIKEQNNIRGILNVIYEINIPFNSGKNGRTKKENKCRINVDFILYNQSEMAEIELNWVNRSKHHILQLGFNLKEKIANTKSEDLLSVIKREIDPDYDIYSKIPAPKGVELKTNTFPFQRFVNSQNLTLITKGINEYEVNKNTLYLTLLRSVSIISNPENPCRGTPAGPPINAEKMMCLGKNRADIAFAFTYNENKMYKLADEYYNPCVI